MGTDPIPRIARLLAESGLTWNPARARHHAARAHALPALYQAAATGLPALADPGYEGADIGILIPVRQSPGGRRLYVNNRTRNALQRSLLTGRTRVRSAHRSVAHPPLHHRQPQQNRPHRQRGARPPHLEHGYIT